MEVLDSLGGLPDVKVATLIMTLVHRFGCHGLQWTYPNNEEMSINLIVKVVAMGQTRVLLYVQ